MDEEEIKKLIGDLEGSDEEARVNALNGFHNLVNVDKVDISIAIPALAKALYDTLEAVREQSGKIMSQHYINKRDLKKIDELLNSESPYAVYAMVEALRQKIIDISQYIPVLEKFLSYKPNDVSPMVSAVVRSEAAKTLTYYYIGKVNWPKIFDLLKNSDEDVRYGAILILQYSNLGELDHPAFIVLVSLLSDDWDIIQFDVANILFRQLEIKQKKENAKLILDQISKSKIDKNFPQVTKLIVKCEEILKK